MPQAPELESTSASVPMSAVVRLVLVLDHQGAPNPGLTLAPARAPHTRAWLGRLSAICAFYPARRITLGDPRL